MVDRGLMVIEEVRARLVSANQNSPSQPSALLTDFYELSMLDACYRLGMEQVAVFKFFVRRLPERRSFLIAAGLEQAPVDAYCLGTRLSVSEDAPALDCAYKLQQYAGRPCRKLSQWKETWPGPRQVYRQYDSSGCIAMDVLGCEDEIVEGKPLLREVMTNGHRKGPSPSLQEIRSYCARQLAELPCNLKTLEKVIYAPVKVSQRQHDLAAEVARAAH